MPPAEAPCIDVFNGSIVFRCTSLSQDEASCYGTELTHTPCLPCSFHEAEDYPKLTGSPRGVLPRYVSWHVSVLRKLCVGGMYVCVTSAHSVWRNAEERNVQNETDAGGEETVLKSADPQPKSSLHAMTPRGALLERRELVSNPSRSRRPSASSYRVSTSSEVADRPPGCGPRGLRADVLPRYPTRFPTHELHQGVESRARQSLADCTSIPK